MNSSWQTVIDFYKIAFGIPEKVVNFLAVYEILESCCTGMSNDTIAKYLSEDSDYVKGVLIEFLNFRGWDKDLDISPLFVYNKVSGMKELYWASVMAIPDLIPRSYVEKSYSICNKFLKIERMINKYYG
jgi:hypothetical protein